jgi:hypothetical protein
MINKTKKAFDVKFLINIKINKFLLKLSHLISLICTFDFNTD